MSLVSRLIPVNNRMSVLAARLGVPQYQKVVLKQGSTYTVLMPDPLVKSPTKQDVVKHLANQVDINQDDLWVESIPRTYTVEQLSRATAILEATEVTPGIWVGTNCQVLFVDRNELLTYKILVRKLRVR